MSYQPAARDAAKTSRVQKHTGLLLAALTAAIGQPAEYRIRGRGERGLRWAVTAVDPAKETAEVTDGTNTETVGIRDLVHAPLAAAKQPATTVAQTLNTPELLEAVPPTALGEQTPAAEEVVHDEQIAPADIDALLAD